MVTTATAVLLFSARVRRFPVVTDGRVPADPGARHTSRPDSGTVGMSATRGELRSLWARVVTSTCEVRVQCISRGLLPRCGPPGVPVLLLHRSGAAPAAGCLGCQ